jgi:hypothetical protein
MAAKLTQAQVLAKLGITKSEMSKLAGSGKLQQYLNQEAALRGLPAPFAPSAISAVTQDLIPLAVIGAAGAAGGAAGDAAAGGAAGDAAAGGAAGTGLTSGLSTLAKDATAGAVLSTLLSGGYMKYAAIWGGLFILGLVLIVKGLGVSTPSPTKIVPVPA